MQVSSSDFYDDKGKKLGETAQIFHFSCYFCPRSLFRGRLNLKPKYTML